MRKIAKISVCLFIFLWICTAWENVIVGVPEVFISSRSSIISAKEIIIGKTCLNCNVDNT